MNTSGRLLLKLHDYKAVIPRKPLRMAAWNLAIHYKKKKIIIEKYNFKHKFFFNLSSIIKVQNKMMYLQNLSVIYKFSKYMYLE